MVPGASPFVDILQGSRAPQAIDLIRENCGAVYDCANFNSSLIAKTKLRLYVKTKRGQRKSSFSSLGLTRKLSMDQYNRLEKDHNIGDVSEVEEVKEHPLLTLLNNPNIVEQDGVGMNRYTLAYLTQSYLELVGRSYWWIEKKGPGGTPSALWILASQFVTEWPGQSADDKVIGKYVFAWGAGKAEYDPSEVVAFRFPDPATGGYTGGWSPLRAAIEHHRLARMSDALTGARVKNGGRPDAVWSPAPQGAESTIMGSAEAARMALAFKARFSQAAAGGVMVSETPGVLQPLSWPINDIIDSARYELTRKQIAGSFQVPITKLDRNVANRASAQSGDYAHALDAGLPRLRMNEGAINTFLIPMYGEDAAQRLFVAYDNPPGLEDPELEQKRLEMVVNRGGLSNNELRKLVGADEVPEGEQYLVTNNMAPLQPDGKPDPAYYRGANAPLAQDEGDTTSDKPLPPQPKKSVRDALRRAGYSDVEAGDIIVRNASAVATDDL